MTALAKDPKQRFGSVLAFARALEQASQSDGATLAKSSVPPTQVEAQVSGVVTPSGSSVVLIPPVEMPSTLSPTLPVHSPSPPKQPTAISKPLGTTLYMYQGHSGKIVALAWSPDGMRIASASMDKTVQVWDTATGKNLHTYTRLSKGVHAVTWSPDGKCLAFTSGRKIQVWDTAENKLMLTYEDTVPRMTGSGLESYPSQPTAVAWSPDGKSIASGSKNATVQVWDTATGKRIVTYRRYSSPISALTWSPAGKRIAFSTGSIALVWDTATDKLVLTYEGHTSQLSALAWSPDGKSIASGSRDKTVQVWDAATGKRIVTYRGNSSPISALTWSPDGKRIAFSTGSSAQVWDTATDKLVLTYKDAAPRPTGSGHEVYKDQLFAVAWSPDGKYVATGGDSAKVQVWVAEGEAW
jgi:WD40 repeat protein